MLRLLCKATFNFLYFFFSNLISIVQRAIKFILLLLCSWRWEIRISGYVHFPVQPIEASQIDWAKQPALIVSGFWMWQIWLCGAASCRLGELIFPACPLDSRERLQLLAYLFCRCSVPIPFHAFIAFLLMCIVFWLYFYFNTLFYF